MCHNHKISKSCLHIIRIDDTTITSTHTLHLSRSYLIQHNAHSDVTLTAFGVVWCDQKDPLGAVSAGYH